MKSAARPKPKTIAFEAIGTHWVIEVFDSSVDTTDIPRTIAKHIGQFDRTYSRFRDDSLVAEMAKQPGVYQLPDGAAPMLDLYAELYGHTQGAMTPLIGQTLADAGYDAQYSFRPKQPVAPRPMTDVLSYDEQSITLHEPVLLDFGALGKGRLVDVLCDVLRKHGIYEFCINAGGDMYYATQDMLPLEIGLEHPQDNSQAVGVARIINQALCGSSISLRNWGAYHHIINGLNATSPRHIAALWVTAESTMLADALTTALFFAPPEQLQSQYAFEYAIIDANMNVIRSAAFPATFFGEGA